MATRIEFYQQLREHIPEEAARMIAEHLVPEREPATKHDLEMSVQNLEMSVERLRTSMFRWQLTFFVPLWIGVYATLVAIILRGSP